MYSTHQRGPGAVVSLAATLREWLDDFVLDMQRRGLSERSRYCYRCDLSLFVKWVEGQSQLQHPGDLTSGVLEQYQMHLMLRPCLSRKTVHPRRMTAGSRNRHLAELKSFFRFLKRSHRLLSNPSADLEAARERKRLPRNILSVPEVARLLEAVPKDQPTGLRDWAALELLYGTGLRRRELLQLELGDVRLGEELVHILGKGDRERLVPMGAAARRAMARYLTEGRPLLVKGGHRKVMVSGFHGGPMGEKELLRRLREHAARAGIEKKLSFHLFRHTCATHLLRGGADLRSIQVLLGHCQLQTTALYTRVEIGDLRKTLQECHPREQDRLRPPG